MPFAGLTARLLRSGVLLGLFVATPQVLAAKYGIVDMQRVILNVSEGKEARSQLEKEIKAKESELKQAKEELDAMNKEWKSQAAILSESARMKKQQEFQEKFMAFRNQEMTFQAEIKRKEQLATQKIAVKISKFVTEMAKKQNYDLVFETNSSGLVYVKSPVDMTDDVIKSFEAKSKEKS